MSRVAEPMDATHSATRVVRARVLSFAAGVDSSAIAGEMIGLDGTVRFNSIKHLFEWRAWSGALPALV